MPGNIGGLAGYLLVIVCLAIALSAYGGGSADGGGGTSTPSTATVRGKVVSAVVGTPIANTSVRAGASTTSSAAAVTPSWKTRRTMAEPAEGKGMNP